MIVAERSPRVGGWIAGLSIVLAAGCEFPGKPKPADRYVPPSQEVSFDVLFQRNCVGCHGADGKLGPAPPLNDKLFIALVPDAELQRAISEGRRGTLMPAFATAHGGQLTSEQVTILANGIKPRWGPAQPPPSGAPPYLLAPAQPDGAGSREAGAQVFARACASCHGSQGQGGTANDETNDKKIGAINNTDFLALISDQALRRLVITGRPDLGMPSYADAKGRPQGFTPLTSQDVTDVVALMAAWRTAGSDPREGN